MQKKGKNEIKLAPRLKKMVESFCRSAGRDVNEFLEEAILDKIELEELKDDEFILEKEGPSADSGGVFVEEPEEDSFKRKH
jgi:predicted transcriptional regulator